MTVPSTTGHADSLPAAIRLLPGFDADRLHRDLRSVTGHRWHRQRTHPRAGTIGPAAAIDWRVLPLHSPGGDPRRTDPGGPGPVDFAPTPWLDRTPYLAEIIRSIPAPLNAVRLMSLGPGAVSSAHRDSKYALDRGLCRLHLPLATQPGAVLVLDGVDHRWQVGEFWYGDFSREHLVRNTGPVARVHAVLDVLLTPGLLALFPAPWRAVIEDGDPLLNRHHLPTTTQAPSRGGAVRVPRGLTDFEHDDPLDGPLETARIEDLDGRLTLTTAARRLALAPVSDDEYRFAGWSEQRTLAFADGALVVAARRGRRVRRRSVPQTLPSAADVVPARATSAGGGGACG